MQHDFYMHLGNRVHVGTREETLMKKADFTLVLRQVDGARVKRLLSENPDWSAAAQFDVIAERDRMESFIREISRGQHYNPEQAAEHLMREMRIA